MRLLLNLLLVFLLFPVFASAQANFQPSVVVNLKGDTIHGFIDYSEWENSPRSISFKTTPGGATVKLTTDSIAFFSAAVGHLASFVAYSGPVSTDVTDIQHVAIGRDTSYKLVKVFLRVEQEGKNMILLSLTDVQKTRFFIARNFSDKPVELVYKVYYRDIDENGYDRTQYDYTFKSQLYQLAEHAGLMNTGLKKQIKIAEYKEPDLLHITSLINGVSETDQTRNNPRKTKGIFKAVAIAALAAVIIWVIHDFGAHHNNY
jgi:hypothetical protein